MIGMDGSSFKGYSGWLKSPGNGLSSNRTGSSQDGRAADSLSVDSWDVSGGPGPIRGTDGGRRDGIGWAETAGNTVCIA